jgi:hypothetical protein
VLPPLPFWGVGGALPLGNFITLQHGWALASHLVKAALLKTSVPQAQSNNVSQGDCQPVGAPALGPPIFSPVSRVALQPQQGTGDRLFDPRLRGHCAQPSSEPGTSALHQSKDDAGQQLVEQLKGRPHGGGEEAREGDRYPGPNVDTRDGWSISNRLRLSRGAPPGGQRSGVSGRSSSAGRAVSITRIQPSGEGGRSKCMAL